MIHQRRESVALLCQLADLLAESIISMNDQLEQAIGSVLTGSNVSAANEYILKFVETDEAWAAAMLICKGRVDNDNIRYFAANILYTKVKTIWTQIKTYRIHS